jgi:hypothetical protein
MIAPSPRELLRQHIEIIEELRAQGILRTENNPTGDYAEWLFCRTFGWEQAPNSEKGFDATAPDGTTYQIKARRLSGRNNSRQLSAIRTLEFDFLAVVLFDKWYEVTKAALIPLEVVERRATFTKHVNGFRFLATDAVWDEPGVQDVKLISD